MKKMIELCLMCGLLWACGAHGAESLTLDIQEPTGIGRPGIPVTTGIPLAVGFAKDPADFILLDADGKPVPAQFGVQSRWGTRDGSIRWLMLDAQVDLKSGERKQFTLARGKAVQPPKPVRVEETKQALTVDTGILKFRIDRNEPFTLFSDAWLDLDGNGAYASDERMLDPSKTDGFSLLEKKTGLWHRSAGTAPGSVTIETAGPLRTVVKIEGTHVAPDGIEDGCYDYTCYIHAYAGKPYVKIQHTLKNTRFTRPLRSWMFSDGILAMSPAISSPVFTVAGEEELHTGAVASTGQVSLYQDSLGGENWDKVRVHNGSVWPDGKIPGVSFRGYKVRRGGKGNWKEMSAGDRAPGWFDLSGEDFGVSLGVLHFAPQYPKAMDIEDGRLLARLYARYGGRDYCLMPNTVKTHDLVVNFHPGALDASAMDGLMKAFMSPALFLPSAQWVADSKAWLMDLAVSDQPRTWKQGRPEGHAFSGRASSWYRFGTYASRGYFNCGGYHDNMDTVLARYIRTGDYPVFQRFSGEARSYVEYIKWGPDGFRFAPGTERSRIRVYGRHPIIPINTITGQTAFGTEGYEFYRYFIARAQHSPYYKKGVVLPEGAYGADMRRPDSGHFGIYPVVETYHLTCDPVLRDGLKRMVEVMKFQVNHRNGHGPASGYGARYQGWYQLGFAQIYGCTGDETILPFLDSMGPPTLNRLRKKPRGWYGNSGGEKLFMVSGLVAGLYHNYLLTRNEDARDAIIALCDWAVHFAHYVPKDEGGTGFPYFWNPEKPDAWHGKGQLHPRRLIPFALGYRLTGRKDIYALGEDLASYDNKPGHDAYQAWYRLAQETRSDTTPPAAVSDLSIKDLGEGAVEVSFTAPGDDGMKGKAGEYQVKWGTMPLVETIMWPEQKDTHRAFWWARNVSSEPPPVPAGRKVAFRIDELPEGKVWFAMKSFDKTSNISELSNVVEVDIEAAKP